MKSSNIASNNVNNNNNNNINPAQPKEATPPGLPENVLQILKDLNCSPPEELASLERDITLFRKKEKFVYDSIAYFLCGTVFAVAALASLFFRKKLLACLLFTPAFLAARKFLSLPNTVDERYQELLDKVTAEIEKVRLWVYQMFEKKGDKSLTPDQVAAVDKACTFGSILLQKASAQ